MAYYVAGNGLPAPFKNSKAEIVHFDYSPRGYEIRETWMDRAGKPEPGKDRAYGREIEYDAQGRVTRMSSLDKRLPGDKQPRMMNDIAGNATQMITYDQFGNETDFKALDKDGRPVMLKDGYYEDRSTFDENGNSTSDAFFGPAGHPALNEDKAHLIKYDYDQKGNLKPDSLLRHQGQTGAIERRLPQGGDSRQRRQRQFAAMGIFRGHRQTGDRCRRGARVPENLRFSWFSEERGGFRQRRTADDRKGRRSSGRMAVRCEWEQSIGSIFRSQRKADPRYRRLVTHENYS